MVFFLSKKDASILIGNALDHYDSAIYGFLVPILAPLFFPQFDPIAQLILGYSVLSTSLITRPLGTLIFGSLARKYGPISGLCYSLIGVSVTMVCLGCLPTYEDVGWMAPLSLIGVRMVKGIFSAGESTIAKLHIMEDKSPSQALTVSYYYQSSSSVGALIASGMVTLILLYSSPESWRLCFWVGGITALSGYGLRRSTPLPSKTCVLKEASTPQIKLWWSHKTNILRVAIATTFGYVTGTIPFVFMNSFVPLITSISLDTMMVLNTLLLGLDTILVPLIGRVTRKYAGEKVMILAGIVLTFSLIPLFIYLSGASLAYVIFVRLWIVVWGIVFMCPMNFWFKSLFPQRDQYLLVGLGGALGATTLGRSLTPLCLWLWDITHLSYAPALYLVFLTGLTTYLIFSYIPTLSLNLFKVHPTGA